MNHLVIQDGMIAWLGDDRILLNNYHQLEGKENPLQHEFTKSSIVNSIL